MKEFGWKQVIKRSGLGLLTIVLGVMVLFAPLLVGSWVIALLGIVFVVAGLLQFLFALRAEDRFATVVPYVAGIVCILLGIFVFLSPNMTLAGILMVISLTLFVQGAFRIYSGFKKSGHERYWTIANGLFTIFLGVVIDYLNSTELGLLAIGIVLGLWLIVEGWTMLFAPESSASGVEDVGDAREHPDRRLRLEPSETIKVVQEEHTAKSSSELAANVVFSLIFISLFFAIHVLRTGTEWTWLGFISPFAAVIGDAVVALLFGLIFVLPARLFWRSITRPIERVAWRRYEVLNSDGLEASYLEKLLQYWLGMRVGFAVMLRRMRYSVNYSFWRLLSYGLPFAAVFIAINSIWGFSWYFNSENWASAVWQEITKGRIDTWRARAATDVEKYYATQNVPLDKMFAVEPQGINDSDDFSFIVIGDTGEGDPSQLILHEQLIAASNRPETRFLVLSSDVIYPDGKLRDYERNFYLPFKGFNQPIYAIPGNHDWYDSDDGFNANFLEKRAAIISMGARLREDLKTDYLTNEAVLEQKTEVADRLRRYYGISNGKQRAPYFEFHTKGFSLICVDTGIMREVDDKQYAWLESALARAEGNFKMVVLGHPFYVAGRDTAKDDPAFRKIHELMRRSNVDVVMAGDTHDFEHYLEHYDSGSGDRVMRHFVNGGGGAYLSIGTSVAFPTDPVTPDYAYYPSTAAINQKLENETPPWKVPFWLWMKVFRGYPFDSETVSGAFDFNNAPFFQSFVDVRVERSMGRIRFLLYGANGPVKWSEIEAAGSIRPPEASDDDPVEFIVPLGG